MSWSVKNGLQWMDESIPSEVWQKNFLVPSPCPAEQINNNAFVSFFVFVSMSVFVLVSVRRFDRKTGDVKGGGGKNKGERVKERRRGGEEERRREREVRDWVRSPHLPVVREIDIESFHFNTLYWKHVWFILLAPRKLDLCGLGPKDGTRSRMEEESADQSSFGVTLKVEPLYPRLLHLVLHFQELAPLDSRWLPLWTGIHRPSEGKSCCWPGHSAECAKTARDDRAVAVQQWLSR